ncbi:MAG: DoxX family protein [Verrucomicrobiales bacterium]|nr:DoxX family protein [Verrucomicrobiales bacterium]
MKLLRLSFLPRSTDFGLLLLRLALGLTMLLNHGWGKLTSFSQKSGSFPDPLGMGSQLSMGLAVFAEVVCAALLVVGFLTRFAALNLAITMAVAFFAVHKMVLTGEHSGELALVYLAGFVTLLFTGSGKFAFERD